MRWRGKWHQRPPRPKVQQLPNEHREQILTTLRNGITSSPVLSALHIRARTLRGRFYIERVWNDDPPTVEVIGRISPLVDLKEKLLLEVEKRKSSWYEVARGSAKKLITTIANDTRGTFHGLGYLNKSLCKTSHNAGCFEVTMHKDLRFFYTETGEECTVQEVLFHFFDIPIDVIAEPSKWYWYHRTPSIVEVSDDRLRILVRFTAMNLSFGTSFDGTCLYAMVDDTWNAFTIKPNQSSTIATATRWLEKRKWQQWC